ncbi:hypothetical protein MMAG44476_03262 [Mycolicibacterium mageritense DSM 44476 = CIP 104973]|uniref:DUF4878 domain-containing protein n=1 Tax=Mycolicibacterium mageritense TaxID=53462 RepID=A0ABN5YE48_MYCME|nr:DUF4878 domain-containing protein [Mycolicibacterium mageritense]MCC9183694.1 DUF4878 domain-containing protein [Mycolicibacterium mageritense]BBX36053.1 hypothetical protein MMAGJ_53350 [Mycolicibacterium mageritense]GJJ17680.1 hypothetical protein MTY414_13530 [Mycolicibacterium mageritense]CDO24172.1 Lumazine-binding domain protein [Mycolicibacterium mageritense DSM 44476 = CIP 104973]
MTNWSGGEGYGGPSPIGGQGGQGNADQSGSWSPQTPAYQAPPPQQQWGGQQPPGWSAPGQQGWPQPGQPPQVGPPQFDSQFTGFQQPGGKRNKALIVTLIAGAAVLLVIVVVVAFVLIGRGGGGSSDSAGAAVQGYLEALANGDAEAALSYGADQPASKELLTDEILKQQIEKAPISNIRILGDDSKNAIGMGQVHVTANFGDQVSDATLMLKKHDGKWKLDSAAVRLDYTTQSTISKGAETLTAFGKPVGTSVVYMFPGFVDWGSNNSNLKVDGKPLLLDAMATYSSSFTTMPKFELSDSAHSSIVAAIKTILDDCARSRALSPPGCPQSLYEYGAVDGSVTWQAPSADGAKITFSDYDLTASISYSGSFGYSVQTRDGPVTGSETFNLFGDADLHQTPPTIKWS